MVSPRAAHAPDMPCVEQLGLAPPARTGRVAPVAPSCSLRLAVLEDLRARREPGGMPATGAEPLAARNAVPARHHDCLSCRKRRVRDDAARRIDPDQASDVARHPGCVGRENRALIDDPAGARVGFTDFLEHLDVGRQIDLRAAQGARQRQLEQARIGQRFEERSRQLPVGLDLIGGGSDHRRQLSCGVERGLSLGGGHIWSLPICQSPTAKKRRLPLQHYRRNLKLLYSRPKLMSISTQE